MSESQPGTIVIISSPSGGGKTSICRKLLRSHPDWKFSVSYTTRPRRQAEVEGIDYYFVDPATFERLAQDGIFAEHCQVHLYNYGTPCQPLDEVNSRGGVILLDVDVQGAAKIKTEYPEAITVFILPPSVSELRQRLTVRGSETEEQLQVRFENAAREMKLWQEFEYVVVNDDLQVAVNKVHSIVISHPCRTDRVIKEQMDNIVR